MLKKTVAFLSLKIIGGLLYLLAGLSFVWTALVASDIDKSPTIMTEGDWLLLAAGLMATVVFGGSGYLLFRLSSGFSWK